MRKIFFIYLMLMFLPAGNGSTGHAEPVPADSSDCRSLYDQMQLADKVGYAAFEQAITGRERVDAHNKDILTLIDFSKPSTAERLYVLDLRAKKLLFSSLVSHGRNSGENYATSFSNTNGSYQSSLGFFLTENTYQGRNGYSLVLDGLEKGINDQARARAIVIHGAAYANPSVVASGGRLGRSFGCPALPEALSAAIIDAIKGGTLLYIYADNKDYLARSTVLSPRGDAL